MGAVAALLQGVTALLLVYGLIGFAGWLPRETETASLWAARVSFGSIIIVGLHVLVSAAIALRAVVRRWRRDAHDDDPAYTHGESCGCRHVPTAAEIDATVQRRGVGVLCGALLLLFGRLLLSTSFATNLVLGGRSM